MATSNDEHDIEQGVQSETDKFHRAIKKGSLNEVNEYITRHGVKIISEKSSSKGWTCLHVAVNVGNIEMMKKLVEKGALLTEKDSEGYTPFTLAVELDYSEIVKWMLNEGGNDLLTMKINSNDDKGDIPLLVAATKGYKEMTRFLFSKTAPPCNNTLLDNNCYYAAKLLSHCIHAEIFDVAAKLLQLQHGDGTQIQIPLSYESDECMRPIHALAHIPTAFLSRTRLNCYQQWIYYVLQIPLDHRYKVITNESQRYQNGICIGLGITKIYRLKMEHFLVREILRCFRKRIEKISLESELHQWSVHDAMLQAAKNGIIEFIDSMRKANPDLLWVMDKDKRGIFAHAFLNRQDKMFKYICGIEGQNGLKTSIDISGNNLLHLTAELGPSSYGPYRRHESNDVFQMQREVVWFQAVEKSIVPPAYKKAKNKDGQNPRELFTKKHGQLLDDGRKCVKEMAKSFIVVGTLIMTIMFAAAFTVPGGNDQKGMAIFFGKDKFTIFIIANSLSLVTSSSAVLIFTWIHSSRYSEQDFHMSLPFKLLLGIYMIYVSVVSMMLVFIAALTLQLKGSNLVSATAAAFTLLPILVFALMFRRLTKVFDESKFLTTLSRFRLFDGKKITQINE